MNVIDPINFDTDNYDYDTRLKFLIDEDNKCNNDSNRNRDLLLKNNLAF